jgi:chloramphenicol 3-O-phosphotransferase
MSRTRATTVYVKRQHDVIADFVVYHPDHGPDCSVWMVPGTQVEVVGVRYRSRFSRQRKTSLMRVSTSTRWKRG